MLPITVTLPALLTNAVGGTDQVTVQADTIQGALDQLLTDHPKLRVHLFDQDGNQRQHVLIMHNGQSIRWLPTLDQPLQPGDTLSILQLVTGG